MRYVRRQSSRAISERFSPVCLDWELALHSVSCENSVFEYKWFILRKVWQIMWNLAHHSSRHSTARTLHSWLLRDSGLWRAIYCLKFVTSIRIFQRSRLRFKTGNVESISLFELVCPKMKLKEKPTTRSELFEIIVCPLSRHAEYHSGWIYQEDKFALRQETLLH